MTRRMRAYTVARRIKKGSYTSKIKVPRLGEVWCSTCKEKFHKLDKSAKFCQKCGTRYKKWSSKERKQLVSEYNKDQHRLLLEFKKDIFEQLGLSDHPKKETIFQYTYDLREDLSFYLDYLESEDEFSNELHDIFYDIEKNSSFLEFYTKEN